MAIQSLLRSLISALILVPTVVYSYSGGITNRVTPSTQGCGGGPCHATSTSQTTIVALQGATSVAAGQELELTIIVSHPSASTAGLNVAVRTTVNGPTNVGIMIPISGQGLYDSEQELTHSTPKPLVNDTAAFRFRWKAPSTPGTYYVHAAGNAANGNGVRDRQDIWNYLTPVAIVVTEPTSVEGLADVHSEIASAFPTPSFHGVSVLLPDDLAKPIRVSIRFVSGEVVYNGAHDPASDGTIFSWNGATSEGLPVSSGMYMITLFHDRRTITAIALLLRP
jgi:hypothetical protein